MPGHRIHESQCPRCHKKLDGAMGTTQDVLPQPGDCSVCFYCACICIFTSTLHLRAALEHEIPPEALKVARRIRRFHEERNK